MIKLLVMTTLYPNCEQPRHGIFVETRLQKLLDTGEFKAEVIAPVPWFPFKHKKFGLYSSYAKVPRKEIINDLNVHHPRYLVVPKIGMLLTPFFLAISFLVCFLRLKSQGIRYDLVDCHYYYPDGVAVALLKRWLKLPVAITARGSDINLLPQFSIPRRLILWASGKVEASITVSQDLKSKMQVLGVEGKKIHVFRNGVDLDFFKPMKLDECKAKWGVSRPLVLSVGNLVELKGHDLVIDAVRNLPEVELIIVGEGECRKLLLEKINNQGLSNRARLIGNRHRKDLVELYNAADVLVLASSREGMPNVLLESIASGTPIVSTSVGGAPEIIESTQYGVLLPERSVASVADGIKTVLSRNISASNVRSLATKWSWEHTVGGISMLYMSLVGHGSS